VATYKINKGINKPVEFNGLKAQYLVYFFFGMLGAFFAFTTLYILGLHLYGCVFFAIGAASLLTYFIFKWNRVYGEFGLMKRSAAGKRPDYLINRGRYLKYLKYREGR
jgi:hypothetical protein